MQQVLDMMRASGFEIVNGDLTIIAQRPRLAPHFGAIRHRLAEVASVHEATINLKAGTMEHLGPIGEGHGMASLAVVLLEKS